MAGIARLARRGRHPTLALLVATAIAGCTGPIPPQPTPTPSLVPRLHVSITEFNLPSANTGALSITAGPDGAMWFSEYNGSRSTSMIGRITLQGSITQYLVGTGPDTHPGDITTGPDGALWFTEGLGAIGRITTTGAIAQFPLPTRDGRTGAIAAGPDGALWFTLSDSNQIGRITTAGVITEFPLPAISSTLAGYPNSVPSGIAAGSDGNVWFTTEAGNRVGLITPNGTVAEFPVPLPQSGPIGELSLLNITAGPHGTYWFTESQINRIGEVTPSGALAEHVLPIANTLPLDIAAGPNGTVWFTELANRIGRITVT